MTSLQLGLLPPLRYQWGVNFWRYLPPGASVVLALLSLCLCFAAVRRAVLRAGTWLRRRVGFLSRPLPLAIALAAAVPVCWLLRERQLFGDSSLIIYAVRSGWYFVFPDIGASFLLRELIRLGAMVHVPPIPAAQLMSCLAAPLFLFFLARVARTLAPGHVVIGVLFLVSGGMLRVFTGHVEVYSPLLVAVALYLWRAFEYLEGRGGWLTPSLAVGLAIWLHLSGLFLLPSLLFLHWRAVQDGRAWLRRSIWSLAVAALPSVLFFAALALLSARSDLLRGVQTAMGMLGNAPDKDGRRWWVRLPGGEPSHGTDYVLLSLPHVKYLWNSFWVLTPAAVPVLLGFLLLRPRRLVATAAAQFLTSCIVPLLVYTLMVRPQWGPFDWDLFSMTALLLSALALYALYASLAPAVVAEVAVAMIGFQLLFVGVPFVTMGVSPVAPGGPFEQRLFNPSMANTGKTPLGEVIPWL